MNTRYDVTNLNIFSIAALVLVWFSSLSYAQAEYQLGVEDKLMIRVYEWRSVEGEVREWPALTGEYVVGASGKLTLPFVGSVPAIGKTTEEVAGTIGSKLKNVLGLVDKAEASVEVIEHRPFFISGEVKASGRYPYSPGLTVQRAIAIAGGGSQLATTGSRASRDAISATGNIGILRDQLVRLLVQRARVNAETNKTDIVVPVIRGAPSNFISSLVEDETVIMVSRQRKIDQELSALDSLQSLLEREIDTLRQKMVSIESQMESVSKERKGMEELAKKGLVNNTRLFQAERNSVDVEGKALDLTTAILRAQQEIGKANQSRISFLSGREAELALERQKLDSQIGEIERKIDMQQGLLAEAAAFSSTTDAALGDEGLVLTYKITRDMEGGLKELTVDKNAPVQPGDVVVVELSIPVGN
ncbi:polysaccharide biosynthesis/export family protein [Pararhizobium sp. IMCC21322]|uniref:polysaccharide biosynthesis/export family protein n=1 Tax=Pararhizobium sp. IMCC21322 TaxID=3067903 RepID=UPI0027403E06|nr:polysaccharide biosynthesis/export family protein [Pararhizobium sp. IMCC21322]